MSQRLEVRPFTGSPTQWNTFAKQCGASFRCAWRALALWQLDHHLLHRMRRLDIGQSVGGEWVKVGQCAVGIGRKHRVFADSLQLLPEHGHCWTIAMEAVLLHLGPGDYHYGSQWNMEVPRQDALRDIAGLKVSGVEAITLDVVDFRQWPDWPAYLRNVSNNAKRNARRATDSFPGMGMELRQGLSALRSGRALWSLRARMARRKKIDLSGARTLLRYALRMLALDREAFTAILSVAGQPMAGFSGIDFGGRTYFLEGGSSDTNNGTNWHLLLAMLQRAFDRHPQGCLIMGAQYASQPRDEGLAFSRRQIRVIAVETSEVRFSFHPPAIRLVGGTDMMPNNADAGTDELAAAARLGEKGLLQA
ncbi:hypothetical protein ACFOD4_11690 [Pseudoroseomonas globiformis]|uniref:BioF2-like acetyltransferase domain-containing protein n=1 Tax=Teichococcus globiformis TaxID=2307229 RepID=A0ABV7FZ91_9PROT